MNIHERIKHLRLAAGMPALTPRSKGKPAYANSHGVAFLGASRRLDPIVGEFAERDPWMFEDPEGLMSERPDYWSTLPKAPVVPNAGLVKRITAAARKMRELLSRKHTEPNDERVSEEEWTRLGDSALFKLPKLAAARAVPCDAGTRAPAGPRQISPESEAALPLPAALSSAEHQPRRDAVQHRYPLTPYPLNFERPPSGPPSNFGRAQTTKPNPSKHMIAKRSPCKTPQSADMRAQSRSLK